MNIITRGYPASLTIRLLRHGRIRLFNWVLGAVLGWCYLSVPLAAQQYPTQNCQLPRTSFTSAAPGPTYTNNTNNPNCHIFTLTWNTTGFSAISIQLEGSNDGTAWTAFTGSSVVVTGTNPSTALSGATVINAATMIAFIRVNVTSVTGTGAINTQVFGVAGASASVGNGGGGGGGGTCASLGGDLSGTCTDATVVGVEGGVIPASAVAIGTNSGRQLIARTVSSIDGSVQLVSFTGSTPTNGNCAVWLNGDLKDSGGTCFDPFAVLYNNTNTATSAFTLDMSAATGTNAVKVPVAAGLTATANGAIGYDATNNNLHAAKNGADAIIAQFTGTPVNNDCVTWLVTGSTYKLGDTGSACSSGGITSLFGNTGPSITSLNVPTGNSLQPTGTGTVTATQVPTGASATTTTNGQLKYDTTNNNLHAAQNSADAIVAVVTATPGNGNCANWVNTAGLIKLGDAGAACGSGSGGGGGVVTYSGPVLGILSGTAFGPIGGGGALSATETNVDIDSSASVTVSKLYVQLSQALGAGNSVAVTWRDNAVSQSITCIISGASATSCNDTTHSFNVATGDLLDYQFVFTGTILVSPTITIMSAFGTSQVGVTSVFGNSGPTVGATGDINATGRVVGINSVPLCTGFTPANGQNLQYTTASSPNPCYTAATGASSGLTSLFGNTGPTITALTVPTGDSLQPSGTGILSSGAHWPNPATGGNTTTIPLSGWTLQNVSNAHGQVNDFFADQIVMSQGNYATTQWSAYTRSITVPYTLIATIKMSCAAATNTMNGGVGVSDGTQYQVLYATCPTSSANMVYGVTDLSTLAVAGTVVGGPTANTTGLGTNVPVKVANDGTHRTWSYWSNGAWVQLLQQPSSTFLTETSAGILGFVNISSGGYSAEEALTYWSVQ